MNEETKQHFIVCEGFDDRAFWSGWLRSLGCIDPTNRGSNRQQALDKWGGKVEGGNYLFETTRGSKIILYHLEGVRNAEKATTYLLTHEVHVPDEVILNLDSDAETDDSNVPGQDRIRQIARSLGGDGPDAGPWTIGGSTLDGVLWTCDDPDTPGVPSKQTLERLVTASIRAAYPDRAPAVAAWLAAEPRGEVIPKSVSYSYLAKWYARHGAADFFECVWRDEPVAAELRRRLEASGAWATVERLVAD